VFGAESFGNPDQTWGRAKIEVTGSVAGEAVDLHCSVDSVSVIPEQCVLDVTRVVPLSVGAGTSTFVITLTCKVEVDVKAQSAGFFGTITGAASAGANFENSLRIGRITGLGGAPLPPGIVIRSARNGVVLEDTSVHCLADLDNDSDSDSDDIIAFFAAWEVGDLLADTDGDSDTDSDDITVFFNAWDAGC